MAKQVQFRRLTSDEMSNFVGADGELIVNKTTKSLHIHDGVIAGGNPLAKGDDEGKVIDSLKLGGNESSYFLDRANHAGSQSIDTIDGLQDTLDVKASINGDDTQTFKAKEGIEDNDIVTKKQLDNGLALKAGISDVSNFKFKKLMNTERSFSERWCIGLNYNNQLVFWGIKNGYFGSNGGSSDALGAYIMAQPLEKINNNIGIKDIVPTTWGLYVLYEDGDLYTQGHNGYGQLGTGNTSHQYELVKVLDNVIKVSTSSHGYHQDYITVLALRSINGTNEVWGCGRNSYGQLGRGNTNDNRTTFEKAQFTADLKDTDTIIDIFVCDTHVVSTYALTDTGKLFSCGWNGDGGCLGLGDTTNRSTFAMVSGSLSGKKVVQFVCSGGTRSGDNGYYRHSCLALTDDNEVYSWGYGGNGELGLGNTDNYNSPQKNDFFDDKEVKSIYGFRGSWTNHHVLLTNGDCYGFGYNHYGSLGINSGSNNIKSPTKVNLSKPIKDVFYGAGSGTYSYCHGTMFLTEDDEVYVAGYDGENQVGDRYGQANSPRIIKIPRSKNNVKVKQVSTGGHSSAWSWFVLLDNGQVWAWGDNNYQQCRLYDSTGNIAIPSLIGV